MMNANPKSPKNSVYHRLVIHLNNLEHKKDFHTTHTYYGVTTQTEAIGIVRSLHSLVGDTEADFQRKIKRVVYQGKEISAFKEHSAVDNGWIVK